MTIIFYINRSEVNRVDKYLTWLTIETDPQSGPPRMIGTLKEDTSTTSPDITVEALDEWPSDEWQLITSYNYCYIVEWKRYYFIADRTTGPNKLITLSLELDPLMSFKDMIKASKARVTSYQGSQETEVDNGALSVKSSGFTRIIKWENSGGLDIHGQLVLLTAGPQKFTSGGN